MREGGKGKVYQSRRLRRFPFHACSDLETGNAILVKAIAIAEPMRIWGVGRGHLSPRHQARCESSADGWRLRAAV